MANLKYKSHYYASLRNFKNVMVMNFTPDEFAQGLYFLTFTFNYQQKDLKFSFAPWTEKSKKCPFSNCDNQHFYQTVSRETTSFLAEKRIAKKRLNREIEGVNDLFATAIAIIQKNWKPHNFKWVAVPELHKCQTLCHWKGKKTKKKGWKNHSENNCSCRVNHECLRNWHIHMVSTDFLPPQYAHEKCGLGKYTDAGSPSGCWDHRAYLAHEIWPYGLVDIKRVSHLKVQGKPIHSAEGIILYLIKYLAKSFQMRANPELSQKVGLLPGMGIYKFFRVIYGYDGERVYIAEKRKKPALSSQIFLNNDYDFAEEVEDQFSEYFEKEKKFALKKNAKHILAEKEGKNFFTLPENLKITDLLKLCLLHSSQSKIKQNQFWKPCDTSDEGTWTKGQGWKVHCPITLEHHTEPLIRWEFNFNGKKAYSAFTNLIQPALSLLNLPPFQKFRDYQIQDADYLKFAVQTKLPWNKVINEYEPLEEIGESAEDKNWRETIPPELIYNHVYLKEIRSQISSSHSSWELNTDEAIKRYADY